MSIIQTQVPNPSTLFKIRVEELTEPILSLLGSPLFMGASGRIYKSDVFAKALEIVERSGMVFLQSDKDILITMNEKVKVFDYILI